MNTLKSPYTQGCLAQEAQQLCKRLGDSKAMANTLVLLAEVRGCHGVTCWFRSQSRFPQTKSTHDTPPKENMSPSTTLASKATSLPTPICSLLLLVERFTALQFLRYFKQPGAKLQQRLAETPEANVDNDDQKEALTLVKEARERYRVSWQNCPCFVVFSIFSLFLSEFFWGMIFANDHK